MAGSRMKQVLLGAFMLILLLLLARAGSGAAQVESRPAVDFAGVTDVPGELQEPVIRALAAAPGESVPAGPLTVSVFEQSGDLVHLVLVPTAVVESGWQLSFADEEIVDIFARRAPGGGWQAHVVSAATLPLYADLLPPGSGQPAREPAATFLFPWTGGRQWRKLGYPGFHGQNAIDFKPLDLADRAVLSAGAGTLTQVCNDEQQAILRVDHGASSTRYLHLDATTIPGDLLYQEVDQGHLLGLLYDGHAVDDGWCWESPDWQYNTRCGCGTTMHLHLESSDPQITIDGYNYTDVAFSPYNTRYLSHNATLSPFSDSRFLEQEGVAARMATGHSYDVSISFQNVGNVAWDGEYVLSFLHPTGGLTWDRARVYLGAGEEVAPGESKRFDFTITAPATPGSYDFQWQLLGPAGEPVGEPSPLVQVEVFQTAPYGVLEWPAPGAVSGSVPVAGWATVAGSVLEAVELWVDGQFAAAVPYGAPRPDAGGNYGFQGQWDTGTVAPGSHTVRARAVAANGQAQWLPLANGDAVPIGVTVAALPTGTVEAPLPGSTLSGTVAVSGRAQVAGSSLQRVDVYVDGRLQGAAALSGDRYRWEWESDRAGSGDHTLQVRAIAASGAARWLPPAADEGLAGVEVTVAAGTRPGDANGDGRVDGMDYAIWLRHAGSQTAAGPAAGDFDGNGWVDDLDRLIWERNYDA